MFINLFTRACQRFTYWAKCIITIPSYLICVSFSLRSYKHPQLGLACGLIPLWLPPNIWTKWLTCLYLLELVNLITFDATQIIQLFFMLFPSAFYKFSSAPSSIMTIKINVSWKYFLYFENTLKPRCSIDLSRLGRCDLLNRMCCFFHLLLGI